MMIDPTSRFPLLISDQAEVMRIFLELMSERTNPAQHFSEFATDKLHGPRSDSNPAK
jgi:hypothetical protein